MKWYFTKKFLVAMILAVGPLALPLLWLNPYYSGRAKILWTVILVAGTYALGIGAAWAYKVLMTNIGFPELV